MSEKYIRVCIFNTTELHISFTGITVFELPDKIPVCTLSNSHSNDDENFSQSGSDPFFYKSGSAHPVLQHVGPVPQVDRNPRLQVNRHAARLRNSNNYV